MEAEQPTTDIAKIKKSLKNTGNSVYAVGWLTIILNVGIYLWSVLDKHFAESGLPVSDLSGMVLMIVAASIFIILGSRIKALVDKNIKLYLQILLCLSALLLIWVFASGGRVGLLFFIVIAYLISSLVSVSRAMKSPEFTATLTSPRYKLDNKGWIMFAMGAVVLFLVALGIDTSKGSGVRDAAQQNVNNYFTDTSTWKEFTSPVGGFKAVFPTYPQHTTDTQTIPNSRVTVKSDGYESDLANGTRYMINVFSYSEGLNVSNPDNNLEGALNGMISSTPGNKVLSSNIENSGKYPTLNFLIQNQQYYLKGKAIMAGRTMYQMMVVYENANYSEADYDKFLNSLEI
jgi:hypothetical protein